MITISPTVRIVLGLLLTLLGLLVLGSLSGVIPDQARAIDVEHRILTNALALQYRRREHGDLSVSR
jgi:hypothetical protein